MRHRLKLLPQIVGTKGNHNVGIGVAGVGHRFCPRYCRPRYSHKAPERLIEPGQIIFRVVEIGGHSKGLTANADVDLLVAKMFSQSGREPGRKTDTEEMRGTPRWVNAAPRSACSASRATKAAQPRGSLSRNVSRPGTVTYSSA